MYMLIYILYLSLICVTLGLQIVDNQTPWNLEQLCEGKSDDYHLFIGGDMDMGYCGSIRNTTSSYHTHAAYYASRRWPNGVIPYIIDSGTLYNNHHVKIHQAMLHWQTYVRLKFIPRTTETGYIRFQHGGGCSSSVGHSGGARYVTLGGSCNYGIVVHEIGHALSFIHEQSRPDRDSYVYVDIDNVQSAYVGNFAIDTEPSLAVSIQYDYGSIFHYARYSFPIDPWEPTITPLTTPFNTYKTTYGSSVSLGQRVALSEIDISSAAAAYDECYAVNGNGQGWVEHVWSHCSSSCVSPGRTRHVYCLDFLSQCADDSVCGTKPSTSEVCSTLSCDFEDTLCGWDINPSTTGGDIPFSWLNGPTPSSSTGPTAGHTSGSTTDRYVYMESSSQTSAGDFHARSSGDIAYMTSG